ncbi:uncharacterized protein LOC115740229 isoform X2 [Rhodamnia argentea]|uniref:Uncharacterized protein LOC115740229 isoform X2 n=1 Tax=Rhodamnia argentea TaxID=178133 RepID=A0ABM3H4B7_9MYRT|nr:uncharacterized protein LOC115740229 isoform X2 [Rhodamnia argentea]
MAIDAVEDSSIPSPSSSYSIPSQPRHFYVAVDRLQFKMETLVDLLGVAGRRPGLPVVVSCSSRDELDAVCCAISNLPFISLASLYSDLAETERALVLDGFRQSTLHWNQSVVVQSGNDIKAVEDVEQKSHIVVVTDACLPLLTSGESPLSARVLINYELPTKKGNIYEANGSLFGS